MTGPLTRPAGCPIPETHRRLERIHALWHETAEAYGEPEPFRTKLNGTIQELRNLTWVLQKEQRAIPGFDEWYPRWQTKMKEDAVLRWLVEARNTVVKKGDLVTRSTARAVVRTYSDLAFATFDVPPLIATEDIAADLVLHGGPALPDELRKVAVLSIERRWVCESLPEWELLDALAYCFGIMSELVGEAHSLAGCGTADCDVPRLGHQSVSPGSGGRLVCMMIDAERRTRSFKLSTAEPLLTYREYPLVNAGGLRRAATRYGLRSDSARLDGFEPAEVAKRFLWIAKKILSKDKRHLPMAFLRLPDGSLEFHVLQPPEDDTDKYVMMQVLARAVERSAATALIDVREGWIAPFANLALGYRASNAPDRKEALMVTVATEDGRCFTLVAPFRRGIFGGIHFDDSSEMDISGPNSYLEPVFAAWGSRKAAR